MSAVQFILGRSGTGKSHRCIDAICEALRTGGDEPLILLVPEQATYQAERTILLQPDIVGFSRLRILSFNRLQFWLNSTSTASAEVSQAGRQMILHKLLLSFADELTLYTGQSQRRGLAGKLADLLGQFQQSNCTAEQVSLLAAKLSRTPGQELSAARWSDIAKIFEAYEVFYQESENDFSNPDDQLSRAKDQIAAAPFLKGARLWLDGFSGFSGQELDLLAELLKNSTRASISLCLDPAGIDLANDNENELDPCSLFASAEQTYCQLLRIVRRCKLTLADPVILNETLRFLQTPALAAVESNLISDNPPIPVSCGDAIHLAACWNIRAEAVWAARQIHSLVHKNGYRYRDIAVVVPQMDAYRHYIESAFAQYQLPYFLDRPQAAKTHPLVELTGAALQAVMGGFELGDVFSYLKSPLAQIEFDKTDALESYCRAHDVKGSDWLRKTAWDFAGEKDKEHFNESAMDQLRREVIKPLVSLHKALTVTEKITAAQFVQAVWDLFVMLDVSAALAEWAAQDDTDQQFGHRQLYAGLIDLMDELCSIFGQLEMDAQEWASILTEATSTMTVKLIPPTLDQVLIGSIERSRHPDIKAIFLVGATQKQFPVPVMGETLLSENDYQLAAESAMDLPNPYQQQLTGRLYLSYIALTRASQRIYLSWPLLDEKGSELVPWSGVQQLTEMFDDVTIEYPQMLPHQAADIRSRDELAQWLCSRLGKDRHAGDEQIASGVLDSMSQSDDEALRQTAEHVQKSLDYDNAAQLDPKLTNEIFKFPLRTSVTRLGTYAKCPYQFFARYTLGLEKRQLVRFEPMDVGKFYHDVLEAVFKTLNSRGQDWGDPGEAELLKLCDEQIENVLDANTVLSNFMRRNAHHAYIIESAKEIIRSFVPVLAQLSRISRFRQTEAELAFGPKEDMRLVIPLDKKRSVEFSGFIDRLDTADIDGKPAALIFDYKSSGKSVNFAGMLYGHDLQLPVYLMAVQKHAKSFTPAGAFFIPISKGIKTEPLSKLGKVQQSFNKARGLFDGGFFDAIDTEVGPSKFSRFYNFRLSKEGDPYSDYNRQGVLKPADFQALLNYTEGCIKKLVDELSAGTIGITPYRIGTDSPCRWCDYRAVCRFDWQINDYNLLDSVNKEQVLDIIKQ